MLDTVPRILARYFVDGSGAGGCVGCGSSVRAMDTGLTSSRQPRSPGLHERPALPAIRVPTLKNQTSEFLKNSEVFWNVCLNALLPPVFFGGRGHFVFFPYYTL